MKIEKNEKGAKQAKSSSLEVRLKVFWIAWVWWRKVEWVYSTPLGLPVPPDVNKIAARSVLEQS